MGVGRMGCDVGLFYSYLLQAFIDGLMHEKCNSIANALELCMSCTNP